MKLKKKLQARTIPVEQAVGHILAHDITEIRPGISKGTAFKKGQVIQAQDIDHLRRLGKERLYILEMGANDIHEDEAALRLARVLAGSGVGFDENPSEGKVSLQASRRGLLKIDVNRLQAFNLVPDIICATRHNNSVVQPGDTVAATRVIPLLIDEANLNQALEIASGDKPIISLKPLSRPQIGLIVAGNEVFSGRIEDKFAPIIKKKAEAFDCLLAETLFLPDDQEQITQGIVDLADKGMELILVTGGMSVDPDDLSGASIEMAGVTDLVYGSPVLPGAMILYARLDHVPILGLPACVLYFKATVFDLLFPRVLAGETITRQDLAAMGHGGLCLECDTCHFPVCPFGK
jgi:hypothetical protein